MYDLVSVSNSFSHILFMPLKVLYRQYCLWDIGLSQLTNSHFILKLSFVTTSILALIFFWIWVENLSVCFFWNCISNKETSESLKVYLKGRINNLYKIKNSVFHSRLEIRWRPSRSSVHGDLEEGGHRPRVQPRGWKGLTPGRQTTHNKENFCW